MLLGIFAHHKCFRHHPTARWLVHACLVLFSLLHILSPTAAIAQTANQEALENIEQLLEAALNEGDEDTRRELAEQVLLEFGSSQQSSLSALFDSAYTIPPLLSLPRPVLPSSAEVYSFAFAEKLVHLIRQESGVQVYEVEVTVERLATAIKYYVQELQISSSFNGMERGSTELYRWLVQPYAAELQQAGIDRLIFFSTDPLRHLPLATLFDGRRYLIDDFEVVVSFGADLASSSAAPQQRLPESLRSSHTAAQLELFLDDVVLSPSSSVLTESPPAFQLQGSHLAAGATANLVGLWPSNDQSTTQLLDLFVAGVGDSQDYAAAFRAAQLQLKSSTRFGHPFYWGMFQLVEQ